MKEIKDMSKAAVKKILVCRQPTGSYLTYRVKLFLSVFLLHNFFSTIKIEENRTCCIGMDGSMSLGKMDCKIKKKI